MPSKERFDIFLAGSIEQGKAIDWQKAFVEEIEKMKPSPSVAFFNPRRDEWDPTWDQSSTNENLVEQIDWELEHLEKANLIIMYLQPGTISPVSLLELGLFSKRPMIVLCPEGYHRKANVNVVCTRYKITMAKDMKDLIKKTKESIRNYFASKEKKL